MIITSQGTVQITTQDIQNAIDENKENNERKVERSVEKLKTNPRIDAEFLTAYTGLDDFKLIEVKDNTIYALIKDDDVAALQRGDTIGAQFFTSQDMFNRYTYTDSKTGEEVFDTKALSQALQIAPYYGTYKVNLVAFDIDRSKIEGGELIAAGGICGAQSQLGCGGGEQIMFSAEDAEKLQKAGVLKFNPQKSLINKGQNNILSLEEQDTINDAIRERNEYCLNNQTLSHDTKQEYSNGFQVLEHSQENIFDQAGRKKANTELMQEIVSTLNNIDYIPDCEESYSFCIDMLKPLVLRFSNHWQELEYDFTRIYAKEIIPLLNQDKSIDISNLTKFLILPIHIINSKFEIRMPSEKGVSTKTKANFEKYTAREQLKSGEVSALTKKWQAIIYQDLQEAKELLRKHRQPQQQQNIKPNRGQDGRGGRSR